MPTTKTIAIAMTAAALAFAATDLSAAAQSSPTDGQQPSMVGASRGRAVPRRRAADFRMTRAATGRHIGMRSRPLTVRPSAFAAAPASVEPVGPGVLVTGPVGFASGVVALPFRGLNGIFPATGDVATNPLVIVGAPLRAAADIAQIPFRIIGAPFGGTTISTY